CVCSRGFQQSSSLSGRSMRWRITGRHGGLPLQPDGTSR
ncbi:MAG: hypothetical protein AVDCRST_MAG87-2701, partial [uncultured Thermomicrobiales bacterium]